MDIFAIFYSFDLCKTLYGSEYFLIWLEILDLEHFLSLGFPVL